MSKSARPLLLHSLAEACFYVRVTQCRLCAGPLDSEAACFEHDEAHHLLGLRTRCRACGCAHEASFDSREVPPEQWEQLRAGRISETGTQGEVGLNSGDSPSEVIDLGGWLKLFTMLAQSARTSTDRAAARQQRLLAEACLGEALKFFDEDNDLPPEEAFFSHETQRQFWERPELFTRQHIADLRFSLLRSPG